jgi:hypothetical protein
MLTQDENILLHLGFTKRRCGYPSFKRTGFRSSYGAHGGQGIALAQDCARERVLKRGVRRFSMSGRHDKGGNHNGKSEQHEVKPHEIYKICSGHYSLFARTAIQICIPIIASNNGRGTPIFFDFKS